MTDKYWDTVSREEYAELVKNLDDSLFEPVTMGKNSIMQVKDPDDPQWLLALATYYPKAEPIYRIKKGRRRGELRTIPDK